MAIDPEVVDDMIYLLVALIPIIIILYIMRLVGMSFGLFEDLTLRSVRIAEVMEDAKEDGEDLFDSILSGDLEYRICPNCNTHAHLPPLDDAPWAVCRLCQSSPTLGHRIKIRLLEEESS